MSINAAQLGDCQGFDMQPRRRGSESEVKPIRVVVSVPPSRCSDERGFALVLSPVVHFKSFVLNVNGHLPKYSSKILSLRQLESQTPKTAVRPQQPLDQLPRATEPGNR